MKESRPHWLASQWTWTAVLSRFNSETSSIYDFRRVPKVTKQWQYWKVSGHMASICRQGAIQDPHGCLRGANNCCSPWLLWPRNLQLTGRHWKLVYNTAAVYPASYNLQGYSSYSTTCTCSPYPTLTWFNIIDIQSRDTKVHGAQRFNTLVFSLPGFRGIKKMMANSPKVLPRFIMSTTVFLPQEWKQTGQKWRKVWKAWKFTVYTSFASFLVGRVILGDEWSLQSWDPWEIKICKYMPTLWLEVIARHPQVVENSSQFPVGWCQPPSGSPKKAYLNWVSPDNWGNDSFGKERIRKKKHSVLIH